MTGSSESVKESTERLRHSSWLNVEAIILFFAQTAGLLINTFPQEYEIVAHQESTEKELWRSLSSDDILVTLKQHILSESSEKSTDSSESKSCDEYKDSLYQSPVFNLCLDTITRDRDQWLASRAQNMKAKAGVKSSDSLEQRCRDMRLQINHHINLFDNISRLIDSKPEESVPPALVSVIKGELEFGATVKRAIEKVVLLKCENRDLKSTELKQINTASCNRLKGANNLMRPPAHYRRQHSDVYSTDAAGGQITPMRYRLDYSSVAGSNRHPEESWSDNRLHNYPSTPLGQSYGRLPSITAGERSRKENRRHISYHKCDLGSTADVCPSEMHYRGGDHYRSDALRADGLRGDELMSGVAKEDWWKSGNTPVDWWNHKCESENYRSWMDDGWRDNWSRPRRSPFDGHSLAQHRRNMSSIAPSKSSHFRSTTLSLGTEPATRKKGPKIIQAIQRFIGGVGNGSSFKRNLSFVDARPQAAEEEDDDSTD